MGGNVFKHLGNVRLTAAQYHETIGDFMSVFTDRLGNGADVPLPSVIPSVRNKTSFGDMDVLIDAEWRADVHTAFCNDYTMSANGSVTSILFPSQYGKFQIDLIFVHKENLDFALKYFSYNDLGNLIGRIAHKMGMKFGHAGLFLPVRDGTHMLGEILLDTDFNRAIEFLGFSPEKYAEGFDEVEDVFRYVVGSKFFNPDIYLLENRNHTSRTRDRKRPTYTAFLEYTKNISGDFHQFLPKEAYLPVIFEKYPHGKNKFENLHEDAAKAKEASARCSSMMISEITGRTGQELGMIIRAMRKEVGDWVQYRLLTPIEDIMNLAAEKEKLIFGEKLNENH